MEGFNLEKRTGLVKIWNEEKGWGFITDDKMKKDIYTSKKLLNKAHTRLFIGNVVEYDLTESNRGRDRNEAHAINVGICNF